MEADRFFSNQLTHGFAAGKSEPDPDPAERTERSGAHVLLAERSEHLGWILNQRIHNGFGLGYFHEDLTGPEYAARFISRMERSHVTVMTGTMALRLYPDKRALLSGRDGLRTAAFERCILATDRRERTIGSLPVCGTRPAGFFTAGAAQKMENLGHYDIGEHIVILGSGDIGQIMAHRFASLGKKVAAMVEAKDVLGGLPRNRRSCIESYHIPVTLRATVDEILGTGRVSGVMVRPLDTGERKHIDFDTLVTAVGLIPKRELAADLRTDGKLPDWLAMCGNCDFIQEIVDSVTKQAEAIGAAGGQNIKFGRNS